MTNAHATYNEMLTKETNDLPKISASEKSQNKNKITIKHYNQLIDVSK